MKLLSQLKEGETGFIKAVLESPARLKLMEMGCVSSASVKMVKRAVFRGPVAIEVAGYLLSMRLAEADSIELV